MSAIDTVSTKWTTIILGVVVIVVAAGVVTLYIKQDRATASVHDFDSCVAAGNPVMESYPEQCAANGKTYTNEAQAEPMYPELNYDGSEYIGLKEEEALPKAREANIPARVIEREGEGLPTTMDFVYGRLNLYVKDGNVYKVEVEGLATDAN